MTLLFPKKCIFTFAIIFLFAVLVSLFINNFIRSENFIYYGDYSTYFESFQNLSRDIKTNNLFNIFKIIFSSIRSGDYNSLIISPLEIVGVFNNSRLAYILSIYFAYFISSFVIFLLLIKHLTQKIYKNIFIILGLSSAYFLSPILLSPMLQGEPAIGGFFLVFASIYIFFKNTNLSEKLNLKSAVQIGVCLSLLPILRRWYVYYSIAFLLTIALDFGIQLIKLKSRKAFQNLAISYLAVLISTILFFVLLSGDLYKRFAEIGFGNLYSFYRYENLSLSLKFIIETIGFFNLAFLLLFSITLLINIKFRRLALFLISVLIFSTVLFLRTQGFSTHHLYLIMPIVLLIIGLGLVVWKVKYKNIFIIIFILINSFSFLYTTNLNRLPYWKNIKILSTVDLHPLERTDLIELKNIFEYLGDTVKKGETLYVLNSPNPETNPFFDGILKNYCRDQNFDKSYICNQVLSTHLIDLLDGFPYHFFKADYVLFADPVFNRRNQQVINKFITFVQNSNNYKLIKSLQGKDINVNIYKRINIIPDNQINSLVNEFKILYPNSIFDQQPPSHPPTPALP